MGCSNSHLRPLIRRCRRRRSKKEEPPGTPKSGEPLLDKNGSPDILQGFNFLGNSLRHPPNSSTTTNPNANGTKSSSETTITIITNSTTTTSTDPNQPSIPLLAQMEASTSQIEFFKMLDQKIDEGPDYDSAEEDHGTCHNHPSSRSPYHNQSEIEDEEINLVSTKKQAFSMWKAGSSIEQPNRFSESESDDKPTKLNRWNWDEDGD